MKDNKGFTLVELLAVIVVLAIIISIAVPSTMSISKRIRKNMFCSKIDFIETQAQLYGEDRKDSFGNIKIDGKNYPGKTVTVKELVTTKYLKKDNDSEPYTEDPRDKTKTLDNMSLSIYIKNQRAYVRFNEDVRTTCDK